MKRMFEKDEIVKIAKENGANPQSLAEIIESGDDEVVVDLNEDDSKLLISLHAKEVIINAPSTATSGTLSEEQLSALKESTNSFIVFANEKYYLNDNGAVSGYLGYSHVGVENSVFMIKNITITESTRGWVLTTAEVGGEKLYQHNISYKPYHNGYDDEVKATIYSTSSTPINTHALLKAYIESHGILIVATARADYSASNNEIMYLFINNNKIFARYHSEYTWNDLDFDGSDEQYERLVIDNVVEA